MTGNKTEKVVEPEENKAEVFAREYEALCNKHGMRIVVSPTWVSTNHGSFEMVLQYQIGQLPKK